MITRQFARWDPFREYSTLQDRMNHLLRHSHSPEDPEEALTTSNFAPPVDVYEDEHSFTLKIDVSRIAEKDMHINVDNNTLTIYGAPQLNKKPRHTSFP